MYIQECIKGRSTRRELLKNRACHTTLMMTSGKPHAQFMTHLYILHTYVGGSGVVLIWCICVWQWWPTYSQCVNMKGGLKLKKRPIPAIVWPPGRIWLHFTGLEYYGPARTRSRPATGVASTFSCFCWLGQQLLVVPHVPQRCLGCSLKAIILQHVRVINPDIHRLPM